MPRIDASNCVGVWVRSPNDVYALECTSKAVVSIGRVYHYAGTAWNLTDLESGKGAFRSIRGDPEGDVFAVGSYVWRFVDADSLEVYDSFPGYATFVSNDVWPDGHTFVIAGSYLHLGVILRGVSPECAGKGGGL
jgi:hypothetical protein